MTEFITMLILAAAASAAFLYWLRLRQRQHELWLPTRPMKPERPAPPSQNGEAVRLRRHMALRVQLARLARESARKKPAEPPDFAETSIQDEPRPS